MKRVIKRTAAVVLAITVLCGIVAGSYQNVQAGDFSAGALQYASDFSFLEALFNASGLSLGLDMLLKTQKDINNFKEGNWDFGDLLDQPLTQKEIDEAQEKIEKLYYGATEAYKKTHGGGSKPTPTPMITNPPAPGITPPVTVAPINPDDVEMPEDWGTMKKNAQDKGILAMGAATAYCVKEAVKGWWDDVMDNDPAVSNVTNKYAYKDLVAHVHSQNTFSNGSLDTYDYYLYGGTADSLLVNTYSDRIDVSLCRNGAVCSDGKGSVFEIDEYSPGKPGTHYTYAYDKRNGITAHSGYAGCTGITYSFECYLPYVLNGTNCDPELKPLVKSSMWPSTDLKDDYDNNRSPNLPELVTPTLRLPTLDEIKDLWKQGSDDEENRPTYVTNFITNHTVQPTPEPEPTKKPEVNPNPGGGTDPDPNPTPSTTPAVNPDPGGGTDPDPNPDPNPNPDPDNPDPDNPDNPNPTPEEEASPYKADLREVFPFCIPFDLIHLLKVFEADAEAPVFEFPLDIELDNPWTGEKVVDYHHTFKLDMSDYEPVIKILRIFQVVFFIIALMLITRQQMIKG